MKSVSNTKWCTQKPEIKKLNMWTNSTFSLLFPTYVRLSPRRHGFTLLGSMVSVSISYQIERRIWVKTTAQPRQWGELFWVGSGFNLWPTLIGLSWSTLRFGIASTFWICWALWKLWPVPPEAAQQQIERSHGDKLYSGAWTGPATSSFTSSGATRSVDRWSAASTQPLSHEDWLQYNI